MLPAKERVFVIAEAGVNHNGEVALAERLVDAAAAAGADAVKFQTFVAERVATAAAPKAAYQARTTGVAESQLDMLRRLELDRAAYPALMARCARHGIEFLSTPFDPESAAFLAARGVARFKIGSGELTNLPFLAAVAALGRPMILWTGMATLDEVEDAVTTVREAGCTDITLLHCVSNYPAAPGDANLRAMATMAKAFGVRVGWSDHTMGTVLGIAAAALGAAMIEKHFTLDRSMAGPDHAASLEPAELATMIEGIRTVETALGDGIKRPAASEQENRRLVRRSLVAAADIRAGAAIEAAMLDARRPGIGMSPNARAEIVGRRARHDIAAGTTLTREMFD